MWSRALREATGEELTLGDLDGWTCARAFPVLDRAAAEMLRHEEELRELEPANGWGDFDGAAAYLRRAADAARLFREVPTAVIRWYR
jgi:hypothetical protein